MISNVNTDNFHLINFMDYKIWQVCLKQLIMKVNVNIICCIVNKVEKCKHKVGQNLTISKFII
jgi:hypothetical protein